MTALDIRTPAQRLEDARDKVRRPLIEALRWINERPPLMHLADALPVIANLVGRDVTDKEVFEAMLRLRVRDNYETTSTEPQERLDAALDDLLDLADCADCCGVHPADEIRRCDHGTFGVGTYPDCWSSFHGGRGCPSEHLS